MFLMLLLITLMGRCLLPWGIFLFITCVLEIVKEKDFLNSSLALGLFFGLFLSDFVEFLHANTSERHFYLLKTLSGFSLKVSYSPHLSVPVLIGHNYFCGSFHISYTVYIYFFVVWSDGYLRKASWFADFYDWEQW